MSSLKSNVVTRSQGKNVVEIQEDNKKKKDKKLKQKELDRLKEIEDLKALGLPDNCDPLEKRNKIPLEDIDQILLPDPQLQSIPANVGDTSSDLVNKNQNDNERDRRTKDTSNNPDNISDDGESVSSIQSTIRFENSSRRSSRQSATSTMGDPVPQAIQLKEILLVIPEFDGKNIALSQFLEGLEDAKEMVAEVDEPNLAKLVRSRLRGEVRRAVAGQNFETIEALKDYIKSIYAPSKSVHQLFGELGNEFQKEDESVIAFANRMRDLGSRILEAKRIETGLAVTAEFRTDTENSIKDCFKRGLKPEIEQRIGTVNDVDELIRNAIKIERQLDGQRALRGSFRNNIVPKTPVYQLQAQPMQSEKPQRYCKYCHMTNHFEDKCFQKQRDNNNKQVQCQLCSKPGHSALNCSTLPKCQICNGIGHVASQCTKKMDSICQICNAAGHTADKCHILNRVGNVTPEIQARAKLKCQLCDNFGHTAATCDNRQQIRNTDQPSCRYCKRIGHVIENCPRRPNNNTPKNWQNQPAQSANREVPKQVRSVNTIQQDTEDLVCQLIPQV